MKTKLSRIILAVFIVMTLVITAIPFASAAELDTTTKGSITAQCAKPGYTFELFKVASLDVHSANKSYDNSYTPLVPAIANDIKNGDSAAMIDTLDAIATLPATAVSQGTWTTSATSTTKTWSNLDQGIYYIRPINYPAGVTSIKGSVVSVPHYDGSQWVYSYNQVNLATKVADDVPTTVKTITNSTKGNVNYTDVSLGDKVNYEIKSKRAGSASMKLASYTVFDNLSAGLTLDKNSVKVALLKEDGTKIADVAAANYKLTVTSEGEGEATTFNVALTNGYLQGADFYANDVAYTSVTYSATLNKYAVTGSLGNPNELVKLQYSNKNGVQSEAEGNETDVYAYTYGIEITKTNESGQPLSGATFKLYKTEANAKAGTGDFATGVSDSNGKVVFKNANNEEIRLASGTYYAVETIAPEDYNVYGKVITINIDATYGTTFTNGTYVTNCPTDGIEKLSVQDTKILLPETGGIGNFIFYIIGGIGVVVGGVVFAISRKRAKNSK